MEKEAQKQEENAYRMEQIQSGIDSIVGGYLREFISKLDKFSSQIQLADVLLKAYEYRYDKIQGKLGNVNDITSSNYQHQMLVFNKAKQLDTLQAKMTEIEQKLRLINDKLDKLL